MRGLLPGRRPWNPQLFFLVGLGTLVAAATLFVGALVLLTDCAPAGGANGG